MYVLRLAVVVYEQLELSLDFIESNAYRPNDSSNCSYTTTATTPYIRRDLRTIAPILRPYNIRVAFKPMFTLQSLLTNVKDTDEPENRQGCSKLPSHLYR